jgi:hypothetical protein
MHWLFVIVNTLNYICEEITGTLNLGSSCYHSFQNLLFFCLLCKNVKLKIHKTLILPVVLYGRETFSFTL